MSLQLGENGGIFEEIWPGILISAIVVCLWDRDKTRILARQDSKNH